MAGCSSKSKWPAKARWTDSLRLVLVQQVTKVEEEIIKQNLIISPLEKWERIRVVKLRTRSIKALQTHFADLRNRYISYKANGPLHLSLTTPIRKAFREHERLLTTPVDNGRHLQFAAGGNLRRQEKRYKAERTFDPKHEPSISSPSPTVDGDIEFPRRSRRYADRMAKHTKVGDNAFPRRSKRHAERRAKHTRNCPAWSTSGDSGSPIRSWTPASPGVSGHNASPTESGTRLPSPALMRDNLFSRERNRKTEKQTHVDPLTDLDKEAVEQFLDRYMLEKLRWKASLERILQQLFKGVPDRRTLLENLKEHGRKQKECEDTKPCLYRYTSLNKHIREGKQNSMDMEIQNIFAKVPVKFGEAIRQASNDLLQMVPVFYDRLVVT